MLKSFNLSIPPNKLIEYLQNNLDQNARQLRRRAVLNQLTNKKWALICCTVEAMPSSDDTINIEESRQYPHAILHEDWMTPKECLELIEDIQKGQIMLGDISLERKNNPNWHIELLPLKNDYMSRAGLLADTYFDENGPAYMNSGPLLADGYPYYPDWMEAARDWLPFTTYHGDDARNRKIIFLLPEARAYFTNMDFHDEILEVTIEGKDTDQLSLIVKGAHWEHGSIKHFEHNVMEGKAQIFVPNDTERLEYVLIDSNGTLYDYQCEDRFGHFGLGRIKHGQNSSDLVQQIQTACFEGEGVCTEFKPFIDCFQMTKQKNSKTKFRELVTTIVAFANTQGGRIYIGINDECSVSDITPNLQKWLKTEVTDKATERYCGVLTSKIRNQIDGDVSLRISHTLVNGARVIIVDVMQSNAKPVCVKDDNFFYVRAGASNKQLPPTQWKNILEDSNGGIRLD